MTIFVRHIKAISLLLFAVLGMSSCIFDDETGNDSFGEKDQQGFFVLHISPLNIGSQTTDRVAEKIKTLRVIVIGKDESGEEIIEVNHLETNGKDVLASDINYTYTWKANPGKKDFYIIANEDYACGADGKIKYIEDKCPKDVDIESVSTLKDLFGLERYKPVITTDEDIPDENVGSSDANVTDSYAKELRNVLKAIYFEPEYKISNNEIFLPYTTFYEDVDMQPKTSNNNGFTMYLVPVATKFFFKFINNRAGDIEIQNLKIGGNVVDKDGTVDGVDFELDDKDKKVMVGGLNKANFLMAAIDSKSDDYEKVFADDSEKYYWVDWLAKVSELSHSNSGSADENETFNTKYGWISDYGMPKQVDAEPWVLVDMKADAGHYPIVMGTDGKSEEADRTIVMGPYYMPESKYEVTYEKTVTVNGKETTQEFTEQRYVLNLYLHDKNSASTAGALDLEIAEPIGNVKALFRNTYVIIVVRMAGRVDLDIYSEMVGWNANSVYGQMTER